MPPPTPSLVSLLLADQWPGGAPIATEIHPRDGMYEHQLEEAFEAPELAAVHYFRSGLIAYQALAQVLGWRYGSLDAVPELLDFAGGFGRVTRFLVAELPPERVWVAEVQPQAVAFQESLLGVHGLVTSWRAEEFTPPRGVAAIVALSLFTHLPRDPFRAWLDKLYEVLAPGGLLVFSVHGESMLPPGSALGEAGFAFEAKSETRSLPVAEYGTTWVSDAFMRGALAEIAGEEASWCRVQGGLWYSQDLYVVVREPGVDFSSLRLARGPEGHLDRCRLSPAGLELEGWAVDHDRPGWRPLIEVSINGEVLGRVRAEHPRPDVARALGRAEAAHSGWRWQGAGRTRPVAPADVVMVKAIGEGGQSFVVHLSAVETAALWLAARRQRRRLEAAEAAAKEAQATAGERYWEVRGLTVARDALAARVAAMEASRFWKLRELWFRLKRRLGLTAEE
jgi:SAM-dependent methyltransferase